MLKQVVLIDHYNYSLFQDTFREKYKEARHRYVRGIWNTHKFVSRPDKIRVKHVNLFTTIHDGNFRRHSSMNVTIK